MPANTTSKQISVLSVLEMFRRRRIYVLVPTLLAAALVVAVAMSQPVRFKGDALLGVSNNAGLSSGDSSTVRVQDHLLTIREALYSRGVLEPVATEFKLCSTGADGKISDADLEDLKTRIKIQIEGEDSFHVTYETSDAEKAMNVTNRATDLFIQRLSGMKRQQVTDTSQVLDSELGTLRRKLADQEARIGAYKQKSGSALSDRLETNLRQLETQRNERQFRMDKRNNDLARLQAVKEEMAALDKRGVLEAPAREKTPAELALDAKKMDLHQLQSKYTDDYPDIARLKEEIRNMERAVAATPVKPRVAEPSVARLRYESLKGERAQLEERLRGYDGEDRLAEAQIGILQGRVQETPQNDAVLQSLMRDYSTNRQRYEDLLSKQQGARLNNQLQKTRAAGVGFRIIEPASLPKGPSTPARSRLLLLGLLVSLGLGLAVAFVAEHMDTSFDSVESFQEFTDLPLLSGLASVRGSMQQGVRPRQGSVTAQPPRSGGVAAPPQVLPLPELFRNRVVSLTDPHSVASEQYRILALKIEKHLRREASPAFAVTSSIGGEGKTLTSLNLAFAIAAASSRPVLLVESDLRKPRINEYLGLRPSKGFSDLLLNPNADLQEFIWKVKDLYLMPGGTSLSNPVELLSSPALRCVMDRLRAEFGLIIVDAPPVLPIVDTHILSGVLDGVLMVVRARCTKREIFQRAMEGFQASNLIGAVVNDVDYERSRHAYAYKYYSKNYKTGT